MSETTTRELQIGECCVGVCSTWMNIGRGYEFIAVEGAAKEVFVPSRNLLNAASLERGDQVRFEVRLGYDGLLMADGVELLA